jgi:PAS domain S-box-containing protein
MSTKNTLLLVEDEALIALSEAQILEKHGYEVITAHTGEKAVAAVEADPEISLILMDLDLGGGMDGAQTAERILETRELPVVFLTNHVEREWTEKVKHLPRNGYVPKNSGEHVLIEAVEIAFRSIEEHTRLREREAYQRTILQSIGDAVIVTDTEGTIHRINSTAERLLAWTAGEAVGRPLQTVFRIIGAESRKAVENPVSKVLESGAVEGLANHTMLISGDGREIPIADSAAPIRDDRGSITGVVLIFRDVSEEYERNRIIREQKSLLEATFESIQDGISILYPDLTIRYVNSVMKRWYAEAQPLEGKPCYRAYHEYDAPCEKCPTLRCLETGQTEAEIVPGSVHASEQQWLELFSYPIKDLESGEITGVVEFVRDITERKRVEEELAASEARWRFALEGAGDGVWDWNARTNRVYFSPNWKHMLGFEEEEISDALEEWSSRIHPDDKEQCFADLQAHLDGKTEYYTNEHRVRCKDGSYKWILDRGKVMERDESGTPLRVIGTHADITVSKHTEENLRRALDEKSFLMAELNHRVKNNLAMVKSLIGLKSADLGGRVDLSDLQRQVESIERVHEKLAGSDNITYIDFRTYLTELLEPIFSPFTDDSIHLDIEIEETRLRTRTAVPLGLLVNEIATNALKHGPAQDAGMTFSLRFYTSGHSERYVLKASNTGGPFPAEIDFDHPNSLGLQLIQALAGQIGGTVSLRKEPYPEYTIEFPAEKA